MSPADGTASVDSPAAPFAELREKLEEQRKRMLQAQEVLLTLREYLVDSDNVTARACGAAALVLVLGLVEMELSCLRDELEAGKVAP